MDGCIAGAACQQRIALGRAHEPDQREGYHRFTGIPQSGLCDDEVVSKCAPFGNKNMQSYCCLRMFL